MLQQVLLLGYYLILFIFGIVMSFVFCNVNPFESKRKPLIYLSLYSLLVQLLCWLILGEELTWMLYPILAHMPIIFVLCKYYNQKIFDAMISDSIAYFLCQPSKWLGLLMGEITNNG